MSHPRLGSPRVSLALIAVAVALPTSALAQDPGDLAPLLRWEADVRVESPGLHRVPLSSDVLREAAPGLSDVRILDAHGQEVPWLLAGSVAPRPRTEAVELTPLEATQDRRRFVYDRFARYETYVLSLPPAPPGTDGWDLAVDSSVGTFTRRYRVYEASAAGDPGRELGSGTLFRFRDPLREKRLIPLATGGGAVVVTLEGDDHHWISPTFTAVVARPSRDAPSIELPLPITRTTSEGGTTMLRVTHPRGAIPTALVLRTSTGTFVRRAEVRDLGFGSDDPVIGGATIHRVEEPVGDEALEIPLAPSRGDVYEVRIQDGDAPPLGDVAVVAIVRQPVLVADLPGDATLRFGGGRLRAPRYDLSALAGSELGRRLVEASLPVASLSASRANASFDDSPALSWAMRAGADVESHLYRHRRAVFLATSDEGLSRIRLNAADLGVLRADLADLRVADTAGRQWPFLAEPDAGIDTVALAPRSESVPSGTALSAALPGGPVPIRSVVVDTSAPFLDRDYVLYGRLGESEERVLSRGRLSRRPDRDDRMHIRVGDARADSLRLVVRDGTDAPLPAVVLRVEIPVPDVYVAAPPGDYALLLGAERVSAPRYEIARARDLILSVTPAEAHPRDLEANPDFVPPREPLHVEDWILWLVLLLSVLVLTLLTMRALRDEPDPSEADPEAPDGSPSSGGVPHSAGPPVGS